MKRLFYFFIVTITGLGILSSCGNNDTKTADENATVKKIIQQPDGTISLQLDNADCYSDTQDPSENTAEWNVIVSKSGRYNVWLSSATRDTTDLNYKNKVLVSVHETRIEGRPAPDKIIRNSSEVSYPYYRADSFIGSMYIKDTGEFQIQVISEQILPKDASMGDGSKEDLSKLLSVSFTPVKR